MIDDKLLELNKTKVNLENQASNLQQQIVQIQQRLANITAEHLKILGKIEAYQEMKKEE